MADQPHLVVREMVRRKVDAGLSAMFNAVGYTFYGQHGHTGEALRQLVAQAVRENPGHYAKELVGSTLRCVTMQLLICAAWMR